jgi:hypothetical protein
VGAKLYGTIPTKLFINININNDEIRGKNIWPLFAFIWFITILYTVAYIDSTDNDQLFGVVKLKFVANRYNIIIKQVVINRYNPMLVIAIFTLPNISIFTLNKFLIVNWSKGLWLHEGTSIFMKLVKIYRLLKNCK